MKPFHGLMSFEGIRKNWLSGKNERKLRHLEEEEFSSAYAIVLNNAPFTEAFSLRSVAKMLISEWAKEDWFPTE